MPRNCPNCFSYVRDDNKKHCPFCSFKISDGNASPSKQNPTKTVLIFAGVTICIVAFIFFLDLLQGGSISMVGGSNCGSDETCLATGLAVCRPTSAKPQVYGISDVEVEGMKNGYCWIHVRQSDLDEADMIDKTCRFSEDDLSDKGVKDLYLCDDAIDEDYETNMIQGAFLPAEEQIENFE